MDTFWIALIIIGSGLLLLLLIYFLIYLFRFVKYGNSKYIDSGKND